MNTRAMLEKLERCEQQISSAQWNASWRSGKLSDANDTSTFVANDSPEFCDSSVFFDFVSENYRGEFEYISRWYQTPPYRTFVYSASRSAHSFDGMIYRSYEKSKCGIELPGADDRCRAYLRRDRDPALRNLDFVRKWSGQTGLAWMQPFFGLLAKIRFNAYPASYGRGSIRLCR